MYRFSNYFRHGVIVGAILAGLLREFLNVLEEECVSSGHGANKEKAKDEEFPRTVADERKIRWPRRAKQYQPRRVSADPQQWWFYDSQLQCQ